MSFIPPVLAMSIFSLVIGLFIYFWLNLHKDNFQHFHTTNLISWLLIALFPVLLIFSYFPESSISGTIKGISMGGAIGAFIFIWWYGTRMAIKVIDIDKLHAKLKALEDELHELRETRNRNKEPKIITQCHTFHYKIKKNQSKMIALVTGHIQAVRNIDIWVNSENTNMLMSRFYERSISANIRYLGAKKDIAGNVTEDIIADDLAKVMGHNCVVQPATVLVTTAGDLERTHNVKRIFHAASVHGEIGFGYRPISNIDQCVTNALKRADSDEFKNLGFQSILFPLMSTGTAKGNLPETAEALVKAAISYIELVPNGNIKCISFIVWSDRAQHVCESILGKCNEIERCDV